MKEKNEAGSQTEEKQPSRICIFVDDERMAGEAWGRTFKSPGAECRVAPPKRGLLRFYDSFSDEDLARVALVVADQRYKNDLTKTFFERLKRVNKNAFILQTSGAPLRGLASENVDSVIQLGSGMWAMMEILKTTPSLPMKIEKLKLYTNRERLHAQWSDPNSEIQNTGYPWSERIARVSWAELRTHGLLNQLLDLVGYRGRSFTRLRLIRARRSLETFYITVGTSLL